MKHKYFYKDQVLEFIPQDNDTFRTRVLDLRKKREDLVSYVKLFKYEVQQMPDDLFVRTCERFSTHYSLHDFAGVLDESFNAGKICSYITLFRDLAR